MAWQITEGLSLSKVGCDKHYVGLTVSEDTKFDHQSAQSWVLKLPLEPPPRASVMSVDEDGNAVWVPLPEKADNDEDTGENKPTGFGYDRVLLKALSASEVMVTKFYAVRVPVPQDGTVHRVSVSRRHHWNGRNAGSMAAGIDVSHAAWGEYVAAVEGGAEVAYNQWRSFKYDGFLARVHWCDVKGLYLWLRGGMDYEVTVSDWSGERRMGVVTVDETKTDFEIAETLRVDDVFVFLRGTASVHGVPTAPLDAVDADLYTGAYSLQQFREYDRRIKRMEGLIYDENFPYGLYVRPNFLFNDGWLTKKTTDHLVHEIMREAPEFTAFPYAPQSGLTGCPVTMESYDESTRLMASPVYETTLDCFHYDHLGRDGNTECDCDHESDWFYDGKEEDMDRHVMVTPWTKEEADADTILPNRHGVSRIHLHMSYDLVMGGVGRTEPVGPYSAAKILGLAFEEGQGDFRLNQVVSVRAETLHGYPVFNVDVDGHEDSNWRVVEEFNPPQSALDDWKGLWRWIKEAPETDEYNNMTYIWKSGRFSYKTWEGEWKTRMGWVWITLYVRLRVPVRYYSYLRDMKIEGNIEKPPREYNVKYNDTPTKWAHPRMTIKYQLQSRIARINYDKTKSPDAWEIFDDLFDPYGSVIKNYFNTIDEHGVAVPPEMAEKDLWFMVRPREVNFIPVVRKYIIVDDPPEPDPLNIGMMIMAVLGILPMFSGIGGVMGAIGSGVSRGMQSMGNTLASGIGRLSGRMSRGGRAFSRNTKNYFAKKWYDNKYNDRDSLLAHMHLSDIGMVDGRGPVRHPSQSYDFGPMDSVLIRPDDDSVIGRKTQ